ncbi:MAG: isoprenylcysteine carboxylmethyltransferase family protein [Deltaproteobacteria bacterium]|nr:isoprenylcysteine carboxylmethyltransferase family protein [Deltaproteobacteria bacterium]
MRDFTPIPLLILLLIFEKPTVATVTVGCCLVFFGELIRLYSVSFIGGVSRTRSGSLGGQLVVDGPFRWVRNPLYVGNFFIALGIAVFAGVLWLIALSLILFVFQYASIVKYEESLLLEKFGSEYEAYKTRVPAWLPKRFPSLKDLDWPESFAPALRSEKRTLTAIAIVLFLLVLLTPSRH